MRERRARFRRHVTPADDLAGGKRNELRITMLDDVADAAARLFERRFQQRKIAALARDHIERPMVALDMNFSDRNDVDCIHCRAASCSAMTGWSTRDDVWRRRAMGGASR
jgi:hypothetical protein